MDIPWYKQKTTWTGIAAIAGSAVGYLSNGIPLTTAIEGALGGLAVIFLRQGVEKTKTPETPKKK